MSKQTLFVAWRELKSYFDSPTAYVFLVAFLALSGFLTFGVSMLYERREADLAPFFFWHPWIYLAFIPAVTMGLWSDERRGGTMELLLTFPLTLVDAIAGKFLAAWAFMALALACTFTVPVTVCWLGSPDAGALACGYFGSFLLGGAMAALGVFASSVSRSGVVGFIIAMVVSFVLLIIGFDPVVQAFQEWGWPSSLVDALAGMSLLSHFDALRRGVLDLGDVAYYAGVTSCALVAAYAVIDNRK